MGLNADPLKASRARYLADNLFVSVFMEAMIKEVVLTRNAAVLGWGGMRIRSLY